VTVSVVTTGEPDGLAGIGMEFVPEFIGTNNSVESLNKEARRVSKANNFTVEFAGFIHVFNPMIGIEAENEY
jgi:hypothetical protein